MEAPLHHYPVPMPAPAPLRQHDAIIGAVLQQVSAATTAPNPPPPLPLPPPPPAAAVMGREQCPRCASRDTKFCYYNNYNTAQPRHFCRACRRYWTLGGSLRNVPVGGSSRKRPRPTRGGPTRAALAAAVAMTSSPSSAATTTTTTVSSCGPFTASPVPAPATVPAHQSGGGLLSSLLLGSVPLLEGRLGFGQPAAGSTTGAGNLAQLGFGAGPLLWPATTVLEGDRVAETPSWKSGDAALLPPPAAAAALWQELAAAGAGAPQLLL